MVLTVVKVAKKIDAIITRIGLNPAITGDSLGRSFPGVLTYTVARTVASRVVQTAGKNTAAGKTSVQTQTKSGSKPGSKPTSSGRYYGGVNTVNTFADSRRSEQQSGDSPRQAEPLSSFLMASCWAATASSVLLTLAMSQFMARLAPLRISLSTLAVMISVAATGAPSVVSRSSICSDCLK